MPVEITMPALSPTMEAGNLSKWFVKEGDKINPGDIIAEIETDKATMEIEAVDEGVLARIIFPDGTQGIKVNSVIALLVEEDRDVKDIAEISAPQEPKVLKVATNLSVNAMMLSDVKKEIRVFSSPLARRLAAKADIDIASIPGSGPHGRVVKSDVESMIKLRDHSSVPEIEEHCTPPLAHSNDAILKLFTPGEYTIIPHNGMRKTIARRLVESKQTVPHFYVTIDCELDALLELRLSINKAAPMKKTDDASIPTYKISINDMIVKSVALALKEIPDANVSWLDSGVLRHICVDIGVAVAIPNGLITPIVRHADEKSLQTISNEMKSLVKRARQRKLKPAEYQGGSTAISNMGMFGVKEFSAILNPPQATIFAIGSGEKRVLVKDDAIKAVTVMSVTISVDHRVIDGALAAELAQTFRRLIENPLTILI
ncbi:MAG: pyruvate dehydrogenase E2 component (dihydrolipoamide acetyltransferase) [Candidatus Tokpelaia sp. JSC188]|nr:MAG: pyruvate dehydrogenase E2 component (dihydrolipoamide acetyltransferase) [Candidatus Tokpelaia sp. JSC188]